MPLLRIHPPNPVKHAPPHGHNHSKVPKTPQTSASTATKQQNTLITQPLSCQPTGWRWIEDLDYSDLSDADVSDLLDADVSDLSDADVSDHSDEGGQGGHRQYRLAKMGIRELSSQ